MKKRFNIECGRHLEFETGYSLNQQVKMKYDIKHVYFWVNTTLD